MSRQDSDSKISSTRTSIFDSINSSDGSMVGGLLTSSINSNNRKRCCVSTTRKSNQPKIDEESAFDTTDDHVIEVFDEWTEEDMKATLQREPFTSRVYRRLAVLAGLMRPLNEQDYIDGLKEFNGNKEEFDAKYLLHKVEEAFTGYQLHSPQLPFDAHHLFKQATAQFLICLTLLYLTVLSVIFALWGWSSNCFGVELQAGNIIPLGFLLLSGVGDQILSSDNNSSVCLWMNSIAILIGVYVSLPVFGAVVLVRLLENRASLIKSSDTVLLTMRNGVPWVMIRAVSGNGRVLSNFSARMEAVIIEKDEDLDEVFITTRHLETAHSPILGYAPTLIKHRCDESSPLIQTGAVYLDEHGVPQWNRTKMMGIFFGGYADDTRPHHKQYPQHPSVYIHADEKGRLPFFMNATPVNIYHWKKYKGRVSPINDLSRLSSYKYSEREFRTKQE